MFLCISPYRGWQINFYDRHGSEYALHWLRHFGVFTLRASEAAAQCIIIGPVCGFMCVCGSVTTVKSSLQCATEIINLID